MDRAAEADRTVAVTVDGDGATTPETVDRVAITELFHAHRLGLVRLAVLLVGDRETAEDAVQDAFAGLYARRGNLVDPTKALAYLRTAVVNNTRSALRRRRVARRYVPPHRADDEAPDAELLLREEHREVLVAVSRLARRQREVLILRFWAGLSVAETADTLRITQGTVKSTTARALARIAAILEEG